MSAGAPEGVQPVGMEALPLLRFEKGFLDVGTDTDGTAIPNDIGWGRVAANKTCDSISKRSLSLPENRRADRLQLVGLMRERDCRWVVGSHLRLENSISPTDGWIASAGRMVLTDEPIALALLRAGREHVGTYVSVHDIGATMRAKVVNTPVFDPVGGRAHACLKGWKKGYKHPAEQILSNSAPSAVLRDCG